MSTPLFSIDKATPEQVNKKFDLIKPFIEKNKSIVPALLWYSGTEINEGGESFVAKKKKDGTIDTTMLDIAKKHLN